MKAIENSLLVKIRGGGCRRYLRRANRGLEDGNEVQFWANIILYNECMS
jgi:hypothetical protein